MDLQQELRAALADVEGRFDIGDVLAAVCPIIERAVAAERERCAKVATKFRDMHGRETLALRIAAAIRALPPSAGDR